MTSYVVFLGMSLALILVPGPSQALTIAQTLAHGRRAGILVALGLNTGTLVHVGAAAAGLSALLATSDLAFAIVKYAGAAYLLYLAIRCLTARASDATKRPVAPVGSYAQGVAVGTLNPKVALFFMAFLPQFVDPAGPPAFVQFVAMGATIAVLDTVYEIVLVWLVSRAKANGQATLRRWQPASGWILGAMAVYLALQRR